MKAVETVDEIRAYRWQDSTLSWGLVPTMGALHEGHLSLVRRARAENDRLGVSIFINPTQFGPDEDLNEYPRPLEQDLALLKAEGVDVVWTPSPQHVYQADFQTAISLSDITQPLEGAARPGHFEGVVTVVAKLFNVFQPTRAYFGQKDAQQVAVIKQMVRDLNFNLQVVVCPIVREPDGLALSSRNRYLSADERQAAKVLYRALSAAEALWQSGIRKGDALRSTISDELSAEPLARIDYISAAEPDTLLEIAGESKAVLLSMAVFIGATRLIDNIILEE